MALDVTPIYRNLRTRVTFFGLECKLVFASINSDRNRRIVVLHKTNVRQFIPGSDVGLWCPAGQFSRSLQGQMNVVQFQSVLHMTVTGSAEFDWTGIILASADQLRCASGRNRIHYAPVHGWNLMPKQKLVSQQSSQAVIERIA
jgi:hypothetical protein